MVKPSFAPVAALMLALMATPLTAQETFTALPQQIFDVDQPGPRGDIATWLVDTPPKATAIRAKATIISLDPHRLFAPAFSVVLQSGDEVLRLRLINEDRKSTRLPAYLRRESAEAPDKAELTGGRKRAARREVRMQSVVEVGEPFDLGLSWTPEGKVDVMVKTARKEEHILVQMKGPPEKIRVISSSGYWKIVPFEFGYLGDTPVEGAVE